MDMQRQLDQANLQRHQESVEISQAREEALAAEANSSTCSVSS